MLIMPTAIVNTKIGPHPVAKQRFVAVANLFIRMTTTIRVKYVVRRTRKSDVPCVIQSFVSSRWKRGKVQPAIYANYPCANSVKHTIKTVVTITNNHLSRAFVRNQILYVRMAMNSVGLQQPCIDARTWTLRQATLRMTLMSLTIVP